MQTTGYTTNQARGIPGMIADQHPVDAVSLRNSETTSVGFGCGVVDKGDGAFEEPDGSTKKIRGVLLQTHAIDNADEDPAGIPAGRMGDVCTRGRIYVVPEVAVTAGQEAYCRIASGIADATKVTKGAWRNNDDSSTAVHVNRARFRSSAAAGAPAVLELLDGVGEPDISIIEKRITGLLGDGNAATPAAVTETAIAATTTFDLGAVPKGRLVKVRSAMLSIGVVAGSAADRWVIELRSGSTILASFDTNTAAQGAVIQNTPKEMVPAEAAGKSLERLTLVLTKNGSAAGISAGQLTAELEVY
jgi:hypothetical protein